MRSEHLFGKKLKQMETVENTCRLFLILLWLLNVIYFFKLVFKQNPGRFNTYLTLAATTWPSALKLERTGTYYDIKEADEYTYIFHKTYYYYSDKTIDYVRISYPFVVKMNLSKYCWAEDLWLTNQGHHSLE